MKETFEPRRALDGAGAKTSVSPQQGEVQGWKHFDKGDKGRVDSTLRMQMTSTR